MKAEELKPRIKGVVVTLLTPFNDDYSIDLGALYDNTQRLVEKGIHVFVAAGSVGEFSSMSPEEFRDVVATAVKAVNGRAPVLAGASHSGTHECIKLSRIAQDVGADGLLIVPPYYLKPSLEGLFVHYEMIAQAVDLPIAVYNNPGFSKVNILPQHAQTLVERVPQIISIKETSGEIYQFYETLRLLGARIPVLMGREITAFFGLACGSPGYVSSLANLAPDLCLDLYNAFQDGDLKRANAVHEKIAPFNSLQAEALQKLAFPVMIPMIKDGMNMIGIKGGTVRPPMTPVDGALRDHMKRFMQDWGLL
ncbi:MAG TPA: dihydrodipicolinate synthase family protein [Dehalococcoidia bacterium]|nr:dihydrodipicolinate synthase family protein [Dehalococcoidia bacterium]